MLNTPECLAPVIEQLEKYTNQISVLNDRNSNLEEEVEALRLKQVEIEEARSKESDSFKRDISNLEEENLGLNTQLRDNDTTIEELKQDNDNLTEKVSRINSENIRVSAGQEALSHQTQHQNEEIEKMTEENKALKEELSSLKLMNSISMQKSLDDQGISGDEGLELEIKRLKQALLESKSEKSDNTNSYLEDENEKLVKRHGEITQEKMQASSKMHAAQNQLDEVVVQLETARKSISELSFEYEGLQNLHQNLISERNSLADEKKSLEEENSRLSENISSKLTIEEPIVSDNISYNELEESVPVLEIESSDERDVEITNLSNSQAPHFPSENKE